MAKKTARQKRTMGEQFAAVHDAVVRPPPYIRPDALGKMRSVLDQLPDDANTTSWLAESPDNLKLYRNFVDRPYENLRLLELMADRGDEGKGLVARFLKAFDDGEHNVGFCLQQMEPALFVRVVAKLPRGEREEILDLESGGRTIKQSLTEGRGADYREVRDFLRDHGIISKQWDMRDSEEQATLRLLGFYDPA